MNEAFVYSVFCSDCIGNQFLLKYEKKKILDFVLLHEILRFWKIFLNTFSSQFAEVS